MPYPKILLFFKIHDFQLQILKKYFFLEKFASNYAKLLKLPVVGAPTLIRFLLCIVCKFNAKNAQKLKI